MHQTNMSILMGGGRRGRRRRCGREGQGGERGEGEG